MERIVCKNIEGDIAVRDIIIYANHSHRIGKQASLQKGSWKVIAPKYYIYKDDNSVLEIWYDNKGMMISGSLKGYMSNSWSDEKREKTTYEEAMKILSKEGGSYSNKDLMSRVEDKLEQERKQKFNITKAIEESKGNICCEIGIDTAKDDLVDKMKYAFTLAKSGAKQNNNGGATDYYSLPKDANTLQDLIEYRNMNGSVKDIFKACYRLGVKTEDELRDANKMAYYSLREIGRITGRKDYIKIAKELMGSQAIEKE